MSVDFAPHNKGILYSWGMLYRGACCKEILNYVLETFGKYCQIFSLPPDNKEL